MDWIFFYENFRLSFMGGGGVLYKESVRIKTPSHCTTAKANSSNSERASNRPVVFPPVLFVTVHLENCHLGESKKGEDEHVRE